MNTLAIDPLCKSLRFDDDTMWVELTDGRQLGVPLTYFPRLLNATPNQREKYSVTAGGAGLHWEDIDEDISVRGLILGKRDNTGPKSNASN